MNQLSAAIRTGLSDMLARHLPERTKRLIFLASFAARLKDSTELSNETVSRLNQVMVLANMDSAIKLPVQLSKAIWHGKTPAEICNQDVLKSILSGEAIRNISVLVIEKMPPWLRYGKDEDIQRDVAKLLNNRTAVLGA